MYRVIAIVSGGLALAACSSTADWFKSAPAMETVRFESEPPGAEAKVSNGQACRTPCALALASTGEYAVTFTLTGYQPEADKLVLTSMGDNTSQLRPNPVVVELTPAPPPPPVKKKPVRKKTAAKPKPKAAAKPKPASAPPAMAPAQQQSPWPSAPAQQ